MPLVKWPHDQKRRPPRALPPHPLPHTVNVSGAPAEPPPLTVVKTEKLTAPAAEAIAGPAAETTSGPAAETTAGPPTTSGPEAETAENTSVPEEKNEVVSETRRARRGALQAVLFSMHHWSIRC